jgi:menaquinone-dependent protoporphyrinogen oxidase
VTGLEGFDAVVLGSAIYMGRWLKPARKFADDHAAELSQRPVWLFSSGPLADGDHLVPETEATDPGHIAGVTHAREHRVFAGRLDRAGLSLVERAAVKAVHAPEIDSRDWSAMDEFAAVIADGLS